ncbi:hypothetical protein BJF93_08560 [Xaviernesmea oryzae]|uniref:diguanylate cyclase n=1 Tax=Xaviernesmea oryzae TaxID=464029 RepID=A0A1Q9B0X6_9HYPH|nr:diguanylate cyclase [Xaviernesmea oryzae]OLP61646.1 hypothetical protein BJF93_08560 [Xaviernesmea oryzae]SEL04730.1 PAS domain S-box-containing protein/diguanylate cyclase (GGDEF) domain-containing protein [Xaviernesmea oryzae]
MTVWHDLLSNLAIVALATGFWTLGHRHAAERGERAQQLVLGAIMAAGTVACMSLPFQFMDGVYLDTRYTFLAVSGFFGGPVAAALPLMAGLLRRAMIGGTGLSVAVPQMLAASAVGLLAHRHTSGRPIRYKDVVLLSVGVAVTGILGFYVKLSPSTWLGLTRGTTIPFALVLCGATQLAGLALLQERRRHDATVENRMYRSIIEALPDCLNAKDMAGRFIAANPATALLMGVATPDALIGRKDDDFYSLEVAERFRQAEVEALKTGAPLTVEQRFVRRNGSAAWLSTLKVPLRDRHGHLVGVITHNRDITEYKHLLQELSVAQSRLADAMASMADGLSMFDANGKLVYQNERLLELFPLTADVRQPGQSLFTIVKASIERGEEAAPSGWPEDVIERTVDVLSKPGDRALRLRDGRFIEARTRKTGEGGFLIVFSDITAQREREARLRDLNSRLKELAHTDGLTQLPNRRAFDQTLDSVFANALKRGTDLGLLMIDVDHFKRYNDTYGHPAGDECLRQITAVIETTLAPMTGSVVARYGGEEVAVILPMANLAETISVGSLLCNCVRDMRLEHAGHEHGVVTVSVGAAALRSIAAPEKEELLREADSALYAAKASGRDCVRSAITSDLVNTPGVSWN